VPEPLGRAQRYMPGLDGVRALAVAAVIGYHLGVSWLPGGLLGVGVFFTLSGYLITDLLLSSWESSGGLRLKSFWARRARRLLPALFVMLAVVATWAAVAEPSRLGQLRGEVLAAMLYVSNWWSALAHVSYFARFGPPSPLGNLWSLAIEEQFYLIWPWLLWLGLIWVGRRRRAVRGPKKQRALDLVAEQPYPEEADLPALELAFADAGGAEAGFRLLGPALRGNGRALRVGGPVGGPVEPCADGGRVPPEEAAGLPVEGFAGADLLALGNLLSGRVAKGTALTPRPSGPQRASGGGSSRPAARWHIWPLAVVTLVLALASAIEMAFMYHPTFDPSRIYDGTDTRAFALLIGAALAMVWPSNGLQTHVSPSARRALDVLGAAGLVVAGLLICLVGQYSGFLYRGGMVLLSLAATAVVASAAHPASRFGRVLGVRPLRWLGVRSYAIYLWHYPIIVLTTPTSTGGFAFWRALLQVAATLVVAELSWRFIESPVRNGALGRLWSELRLSPRGWRRWATTQRRRWAAVGAPAVVVLAVLALAGALPGAGASSSAPGRLASGAGAGGAGSGGAGSGGAGAGGAGAGAGPVPASARASTVAARGSAERPRKARASGATSGAAGKTRHHASHGHAKSTPSTSASAPHSTSGPHGAKGHSATSTTPPRTQAPTAAQPLRTSCKQVVDIGDSTSESLISSNYLPDPAQRLGAQYSRVGVGRSIMRIVGGTSIVETLPGTENAYQMAQTLVRQGYRGCWVLALGTNDAADVFVGSNVGLRARVKEMMSLIGDQPVMWVNTVTLVSIGPYAEANMRRWNQAVSSACPRYPDMAVFNWAGVAQRSWFIPDGIHYSSEGSAKRAAAIADALATAFPAGDPSGRRAGACTVEASPRWNLPNFHY
jgi:peptidoglycan/LPS O-acetylase OafA/YrhL/lysophospholipase L1-like esterase